MYYLVFVSLSLLIVILQTTIVPDLFEFLGLYDLLIPLSIYFSLYRAFHEGLPTLIVAALMMDMLSGAPAGIYLITYVWLFLAFRQTWRFLDLNHSYLFPLIVTIGVLFQQFIFWITLSIQSGQFVFSPAAMKVVFFQNLWAIVSAPIIFILLRLVFKVTDQAFEIKAYENGQSN